jgi:hypothetical protein
MATKCLPPIDAETAFDTMHKFAEQLERELSRALRLAEDNGKLAHQTACELTEARKQRDTLAEALEEITNVAERVDGWESFPSGPIDRAREALAAVKGGTP